MKKKETPDYRSQVVKKGKELKGVARKSVTVEPQKPQSTTRELFKPERGGGDVSGTMFPVGKLPKGNPPEWVKDFEKYNHLR